MTNSLDVVIVEDEPIIRVFLKSLIKSAGHNIVGVFANGEEALSFIQTTKLDLIFMDINIEGALDGISVVRKMQINYNPLIYFISAYNDLETIEDALSTHAYSYITKPIKEEDIHIALLNAKKHANIDYESDKIILSEELIYSKRTQELYVENTLVKLSKIEKQLVDIFINNLNHTLSTEYILQTVWEGKEVSNSTLRGAIAGLKRKLPSLPLENNIGRGYFLYKE